MSIHLVAEYALADHLVVHSEGRISIWRRATAEDARPARRIRPRIIVREDNGLQRAIDANADRKACEVERIRAEDEAAAQRARFEQRCAELRKKFYG